jgi:hypothetical protein
VSAVWLRARPRPIKKNIERVVECGVHTCSQFSLLTWIKVKAKVNQSYACNKDIQESGGIAIKY